MSHFLVSNVQFMFTSDYVWDKGITIDLRLDTQAFVLNVKLLLN